MEYKEPLENIGLRYELCDKKGDPVATAIAIDLPITAQNKKQRIEIKYDINGLVSGDYRGFFTFFTRNELGGNQDIDCVPSLQIEMEEENFDQYIKWDAAHWGQVELPSPQVEVLQH